MHDGGNISPPIFCFYLLHLSLLFFPCSFLFPSPSFLGQETEVQVQRPPRVAVIGWEGLHAACPENLKKKLFSFFFLFLLLFLSLSLVEKGWMGHMSGTGLGYDRVTQEGTGLD